MAIIKCKMCGGDLEITPGATVAECEFCGTKQTLPKANEEVIQNLFNRANALRLKCEFDKAEQVYEKILQENNAESEAHWGIVLCKYGIEYVEDPKTYKRVPTCHRTSYDAVTADADYLAAVEYADAQQRSIYEAEAAAIDVIQKNILSIVKDEKPFDVFICYKESDEAGKRTPDSVIANDIYHQLTQEGLKVFYAAITLEDKLGQEYEPYIFAALNSAKVMLVIGTRPQYFTAVWVKNEWSRFLKLMKSDRSKLLIPCYKDMDAYELPEEFSHLQAQDMTKIGFINDVVRGIRKVTIKDEPKAAVVESVPVAVAAGSAEPLLKRAFMFLEDGDWNGANEYCEKVLDLDPENARAYLGKLMAELHVRTQENLRDLPAPFDTHTLYQKTLRFGDDALKAKLQEDIRYINERNENTRKDDIYQQTMGLIRYNNIDSFKQAVRLLESIKGWKDSEEKIEFCRKRIAELEEAEEILRKDEILARAKTLSSAKTTDKVHEAIALLNSIGSWRNSDELIKTCESRLSEMAAAEEAVRKDEILIKAERFEVLGDLPGAIELLETIRGWKNSDDLIEKYQKAIVEMEENQRKKHDQEQLYVLQRQRRRKGLCQHCGGELKGLLAKKCVACGKAKDY